MTIVLANIRVIMLGLVRAPAYWVPTVLFPTMLYLFFGARFAEPEIARVVLASWSVFAVLGVAFYQFGIGIAQDRESTWDTYARTLPAGPMPKFVAQVAVALVFAALAVGVLWVAAGIVQPVPMPIIGWLKLALALFAGAVPFGFFGIALGYLAPAKAAVPIANLIHLPLAYAGGLWFPPQSLPDSVAKISMLTPTRHFGELAWAAVDGRAWPWASGLWLLGYSIAFAALAVWAHRRDEGRRYA